MRKAIIESQATDHSLWIIQREREKENETEWEPTVWNYNPTVYRLSSVTSPFVVNVAVWLWINIPMNSFQYQKWVTFFPSSERIKERYDFIESSCLLHSTKRLCTWLECMQFKREMKLWEKRDWATDLNAWTFSMCLWIFRLLFFSSLSHRNFSSISS